MPRQKFRAKYGKANKGKFKKSDNKNSRKSGKFKKPELNRESKKYKFIRRNQENEEASRKLLKLEKDYEEKNVASNSMDQGHESSEDEEYDQTNSLEQLMSTFSKRKPDNDLAIESSDESVSDIELGDEEEDEEVDEDDDDDDDDEDDDDDDDADDTGIDDIFPEKFEEQSQPRGIERRSSSSEDEHSEKHSSDSDYDPEMDETIQNLRPEGYEDNIKSFDDSIEDDDEDGESNDGDVEEDDDDVANKNETDDKFTLHLGLDLSTDLFNCVNAKNTVKKEIFTWPSLGRIQVEIPTVKNSEKEKDGDRSQMKKRRKLTLLDDQDVFAEEGTPPVLYNANDFDLEKVAIKSQLRPKVEAANKGNVQDNEAIFTNLQCEMFSIMNNYQDLFYSQRNHSNGEEIRFMYTLHAVNHILKTRTKILNHNVKLKAMGLTDSKSVAVIPEHYRDQGLFRPKVLIVVPFRESALRIVKILISLVFGDIENENANQKSQVMHYKRFIEEYGGQTLHFPKRNPKPDDYEQLFAGNSDDTFRIGIAFTRKCLKLYSDFYSSDILICSPLGLRKVVGAPGDKDRDYDFLASIEVLILDQADVFLAQNWDHLLHVLDHLHLQPQSARNTDFSRVRSWCLNGWSRFYRQTLVFASHELAEFRSLFNNRCSNYRGKVRLLNSIEIGSIKHVAVRIPQTFHRIEVQSIQSSFDQRFDYFISTILPKFKAASKAHCMIFIPSYFDFVRIRNYFKKETLSFTQICEYTKDAKIDRARSMFFHSGVHFMLYSERGHFFRRTRIKGIRHLIMYQPPTWPHFYAEMINLMHESNQNSRDGLEDMMSVTVLYTKYDMLQIASIVSSGQAAEMTQSDKSIHVFTTSELTN